MIRFLLLVVTSLSFAQTPIRLQLDATDAPRRILHARLTIPVTGGPARLAYPKWIPGEHAPTGPVTDLVNLKISAAGKSVSWRRDPVEMYTIIADVPSGATSLELTYDFIAPPEMGGFSSGASTTTELALLSWNQVLLYPEGKKTDEVKVQASLRVPAGWKYGTALPIARETGDSIEFKTASATTMVDRQLSPADTFEHSICLPAEILRTTFMLPVTAASLWRYPILWLPLTENWWRKLACFLGLVTMVPIIFY